MAPNLCSRVRDWAPSFNASSGLGCTSTSNASVPAAIEASARGPTRSRRPVPWLGSEIIGRCESRLMSGMALMSIVLRVIFSKVRIPRSQRITLREYVFCCKQPLLDGGRHSTLKYYRLLDTAHLVEQHIILHVTGADL